MNPLLLLAVLLLGLAFFAISAIRRRSNTQQMIEALGFVSSNPTPQLTARISELYRTPTTPNSHYELRRVYRRVLSSYEMFVFDLFETSGDPAWLATQTVAIISAGLNLPHFVLSPKSDMGSWASNLADKVVVWAGTSYGEAVDFSAYPELERCYTMNAAEPEKVRLFFDPSLMERFSQTRLYSIHARGNLFTFTELSPQTVGRSKPEVLQLRIKKALEVLEWFQSRAKPDLSG